MTEPIDQAEQGFAKLKWKVGQILMQKFLEYNEGKFHAPLEMNPPIHALTEFVAEKLKQERNKVIDECIDYFGEHYSEMGDDGSYITWTTFEVQKKLESLKTP